MTPAALVATVQAAGYRLWADGSRVRIRGPRPLADDLMDALRACKPAVLAVLSSQRPADPPTEWVAGVASLIGMDPMPGYTKDRWRVLVRDAEHFIDTWAGQAAALGWSTVEAFGCHRWAPVERYDAAGLVMMLNGKRIVAMTDDDAVIENARGPRARHFRRLTAPERERAILWELTTEQWDADHTEAMPPGHDGGTTGD
jgi:hypothetical protein